MITTNKKIIFTRTEFNLTALLVFSNTLAAAFVQNQQHQILILKDELARQADVNQKIADAIHELRQKQHQEMASEGAFSAQPLIDAVNNLHLNPKYVLGLIGTFFILYSGKRIYSKLSKVTLWSLIPKLSLSGLTLFTQEKTLEFLTDDFEFSIDVDGSNEVRQVRGKHVNDPEAVEITELLSRNISEEHQMAVESLVPDVTTSTQAADLVLTAFNHILT